MRPPKPNGPLEVIFEDNHLLIVNKPAMLPTMGSAAGDDSLVARCKTYLKHKYQKPGNVFLGVVSRLDAVVSGLVVLARTSKAAARLSAQFQSRQVGKVYWAVVWGPVQPQHEATLVDYIWHDDRAQRVVVVGKGVRAESIPGAKLARLTYRWLGRISWGDWLAVELETGRKHQIRVQLAAQQFPIVGDRKYGSPVPFYRGIALHSQSLSFAHPVRSEQMAFQIAPPEYWQLPMDDLR
ncbi:MAG TPA: RluA family pseudouridine synthase [Pirellulaceae bacterium]|nr:RluA family pseudouridine synthase [Pirellulaceae bacterium]